MPLDPIAIQSLWANCCQHVRRQAVMMAFLCGPEAAWMIENVAGRFAGQLAPDSNEVLSFRLRQQFAIGGLIGSIAHADTMARSARATQPGSSRRRESNH